MELVIHRVDDLNDFEYINDLFLYKYENGCFRIRYCLSGV